MILSTAILSPTAVLLVLLQPSLVVTRILQEGFVSQEGVWSNPIGSDPTGIVTTRAQNNSISGCFAFQISVIRTCPDDMFFSICEKQIPNVKTSRYAMKQPYTGNRHCANIFEAISMHDNATKRSRKKCNNYLHMTVIIKIN